jgi:hypothetical protein
VNTSSQIYFVHLQLRARRPLATRSHREEVAVPYNLLIVSALALREPVVKPQAVGGDRQIVVHGLNRQNTAAPAEFPYVFDNEHSRGAAPNAIHHDVAEMLCSEGVVISAGLLQRHFSIQDRYSDGRSR